MKSRAHRGARMLVSVGLLLFVAYPAAAAPFIVIDSTNGARLIASAVTWYPPSSALAVLPDASERILEAKSIELIVDEHGRDRTRFVLEQHGTVGRPPSAYQSRLGVGSFSSQTSEPPPADGAAVLVPMVRVALKSDTTLTVMFAAWRQPKRVLLRLADGAERTVEAGEVRKISDAAGKERTGFVTKGEGAVGVLPAGYAGPVEPAQFEEKAEEDSAGTSLEEIGLVALLVAALATSMAFVIGVK